MTAVPLLFAGQSARPLSRADGRTRGSLLGATPFGARLGEVFRFAPPASFHRPEALLKAFARAYLFPSQP